MQNRLSPEFIQGLRQQQRINQMNQMQARRNNPRQRTLRPGVYQRQQPMQQRLPLFNQGRINEDFSVTVSNPDLRGPNRTQNQSIAPKFRRPTQGGK